MSLSRRGMMIVTRWSLFILCAVATSCAPVDTDKTGVADDAPFDVIVQVVRDEGVPLAGARVRVGASAQVTDARGSARLRVQGHQGDVVSASIECPDGYASPERPVPVTLYRLTNGAPPPLPAIACVPSVRRVVAAIRARGGASLPVLRFGRRAGQTDRAGAAHVLVEGKPGEHVELTLSTDDEAARRLRPRSPTLSFAVPDRDDVVVLDQRFEEVSDPRPPRPAAPPPPKSAPKKAATSLPHRL